MAERKSGPVKPPTIDLTARNSEAEVPRKPAIGAANPASAEKPAAQQGSGAGSAEKPAPAPEKPAEPKSRSDARASANSLLAVGLAGAIVGGALGLGGAYGLATLGYWPTSNSEAPDIAELSSELSSLYVRKSEIGAVVDNALATVDTGMTALDARVTMLESATPADDGAAISTLDERLGTLESRLQTVSSNLDAATISGGDAAAEKALGGLTESVSSLSARSEALAARITALEDAGTPAVSADEVTTLSQSVDALKTEIAEVSSRLSALQSAPEPTPVDLRLPLALSGMAEALATGAPFAGDLDMIRAALPDLEVPPGVADAAATGLGSPADLEARFKAEIPDILAARAGTAEGDWTTRLWDRVKALVALRPVATGDDTSPEAEVARIEAALADRDFGAAAGALAMLPDAMKAEAGALGTDIARFAATAELMRTARTAALATAGAGS